MICQCMVTGEEATKLLSMWLCCLSLPSAMCEHVFPVPSKYKALSLIPSTPTNEQNVYILCSYFLPIINLGYFLSIAF
jgi:hypothetical protein